MSLLPMNSNLVGVCSSLTLNLKARSNWGVGFIYRSQIGLFLLFYHTTRKRSEWSSGWTHERAHKRSELSEQTNRRSERLFDHLKTRLSVRRATRPEWNAGRTMRCVERKPYECRKRLIRWRLPTTFVPPKRMQRNVCSDRFVIVIGGSTHVTIFCRETEEKCLYCKR